MNEYMEGDLRIACPSNARVKRFDSSSHELSHSMKAVDFIVEWRRELRFIEFKDLQHPRARSGDVEKFIQSFQSGSKDSDLIYKFRDSFLYRWAALAPGAELPKIGYFVLVASDKLSAEDLAIRTDALKRTIPAGDRSPKVWNRHIAAGCGVFNMQAWNRRFPEFPVSRVSKP